jgi:uracil-DNA glycosylase
VVSAITPAAESKPVARAARSLKSLVPSDWRRALGSQFDTDTFESLEVFIASEEAKSQPIFPPRAQIFAALKQTPLKKVSVVIIGQDPYPTAGNANGLAFSVNPGQKIPASLKNIFLGLQADAGTAVPSSGDLSPWAKQGVLLLNTVLTVREGEPNSHQKKGWEPFTEAVLKEVDRQAGPVVFLCFGLQAKRMAERLVDQRKHTILSAPHPSPLNGKAFVNAAQAERFFTQTNSILGNAGRPPINWAL